MADIKLLIQFNGTQMELPVNPEEITISREADNEDLDIVGLGRAVRKGEPGLVTTTIESFFPAKGTYFYRQGINNSKYSSNGRLNGNGLSTIKVYRDLISKDEPLSYISFLNLIWYSDNTDNNVAKIISTGLPININMYFVIENFEYDHKAGEEEDIYYKLEIKQYIPYGVKYLSDLTSGLYPNRSYATFSPFLNPFSMNTYTVAAGDTLFSISAKLVGDGSRWRELYNLNKSIINVAQKQLVIGTQLIIPDEWSVSYIFDVLRVQRGE